MSAPLKASRGPLISELSKHVTVWKCVAEMRVWEWRTGFPQASILRRRLSTLLI